MLHPSYTDLMRVVNSEVEIGEEPVVNSRYSIVIATAKRARQLIDGAQPKVTASINRFLLQLTSFTKVKSIFFQKRKHKRL